MAEVGILDQIDNNAAIAPLPANSIAESSPVNPFEIPDAEAGALDVTGIDAGVLAADASNVIPIDTSAQVTAPATTADLSQEPYGAATRELAEDQLVSGNLEKILNEGGVLMDVARSAGDEYSQSRGMLGSSMGAEASMRAMIDTALPIAQQDAAAQLSQFQQNQSYAVQQTRDSILQSYQLQMENLSTNNKSQLIDLEQKYAAAIQSDKNASDVYRSTMEQIGQVMSNSSLSGPQQNAGMNELIGMLDAYLDFNVNLNSINSVTGGTSTGEDGASIQDRVDALDLSAAEAKEEARVKLAEYDQKISELGPKPTIDDYYPGGAGVMGELVYKAKYQEVEDKWNADKSAIDGNYSQWLRYAENNPEMFAGG